MCPMTLIEQFANFFETPSGVSNSQYFTYVTTSIRGAGDRITLLYNRHGVGTGIVRFDDSQGKGIGLFIHDTNDGTLRVEVWLKKDSDYHIESRSVYFKIGERTLKVIYNSSGEVKVSFIGRFEYGFIIDDTLITHEE